MYAFPSMNWFLRSEWLCLACECVHVDCRTGAHMCMYVYGMCLASKDSSNARLRSHMCWLLCVVYTLAPFLNLSNNCWWFQFHFTTFCVVADFFPLLLFLVALVVVFFFFFLCFFLLHVVSFSTSVFTLPLFFSISLRTSAACVCSTARTHSFNCSVCIRFFPFIRCQCWLRVCVRGLYLSLVQFEALHCPIEYV